MATKKKDLENKVEEKTAAPQETKTEEPIEPHKPVQEEKSQESKATKSEWPEVSATGKFQAVRVGDEYVVYNPTGLRVTGLIDKIKADDLVLRSNTAMGLK